MRRSLPREYFPLHCISIKRATFWQAVVSNSTDYTLIIFGKQHHSTLIWATLFRAPSHWDWGVADFLKTRSLPLVLPSQIWTVYVKSHERN